MSDLFIKRRGKQSRAEVCEEECSKIELNSSDDWENNDDGVITRCEYGEILEKDGEKILTVDDGVTIIKERAFASDGELTQVILPNSVTHIEGGAFSGCYSLKSINFPSSLKLICSMSFYYCKSLTEIEIPGSVEEIGYCSFAYCANLKTVKIGEGVKWLTDSAFAECKSLENISIPSTMLKIQEQVFKNCDSLKYTVEGNLKYLGNENNKFFFLAGITSTNLTSITVNPNCKVTTRGVFEGCNNLVHLTIPFMAVNGEPAYLCELFKETFTLDRSIVPSTLKSITISGGELESFAFDKCTTIESVTLLPGVKSVGESVFNSCSSLTSVNILCDLDCIEHSMFSQCTALKSVTITGKVKRIKDWAFSECKELVYVNIPNGVEVIEDFAFDECESLERIFIPNSVTCIGENAFDECSNLTIYCEAESEPEDWDMCWNDSECPVVWGYKPN